MRNNPRGSPSVPRGRLLVASVVAAGLLGCGGNREQGAMTADLERDLELAVNAKPPQTMVVSALEGGPRNAPSGTERGRRDAVATPRPTPRPSPQPEVQETAVPEVLDEANAPAVAVTEQIEPTPAPVPDPGIHAPAPEPVPGPVTRGPSAGSGEAEGHGEAGRGQGRRGGGFGTLIGVIIRGGSAGIDHCEEHDRRRGRRPGGYGGGIIIAGTGMGGVVGGIINNGGIRPTFPRY